MTIDQLNKANELTKEIDQLNEVCVTLNNTIKYEEDWNTPIKNFIRLVNCKMKLGEGCQAHVILFRDNKLCGQDIPVDLDFLKCLRSYFQDKLDEKKKELGDI